MSDEPQAANPGKEEAAGQAAVVTEEAAGQTAVLTEEEQPKEEKPKKLQQTVEIKDIGPCKKHIKVAVDRSSIAERLDEQFSKLVVDANVSGFRPGKAPRKIIEKRFSKDVGDQVKAEVLLQSLEQLAEDHDIAPLSAPNLDPFGIELPKDGPMVYEFEVEVRPQFDLPNYKGLKLRRPVRTFTDEDVEREQRRLLSPYGQIVPKPEGNAQLGDILIADIVSRDGDRILSDLKEVSVRVDAKLLFKDGVAEKFGEQMKGANAGETRVVDVKLADSAADAGLRGKPVQATFHIKDVKTVRLPELTHDFLHTFGVHKPEQFTELVRALMSRRLEYEQRQAARDQVLSQIAAAGEWDLPRELLIRQARKAMARRVMEMRSDGISEDEIRNRQRLLEQDILSSTARALKEHFVLQKIAEVEKIDVDEEDLEDEVERMAAQNDESPRRVRARLEKEDLIDALAAELIERKALDLILSTAEYEDVPLDQPATPTVSTVEAQTVPGEMHDPTAEEPKAEAAPEEKPVE